MDRLEQEVPPRREQPRAGCLGWVPAEEAREVLPGRRAGEDIMLLATLLRDCATC